MQYSTVQVLELGFYHICAVVALLIFHFPHVIFTLNHRCFLAVDSFSFEDNTLVKESIKSISEDELITISISEDDYSLLIKYIVITI